jgi:hypothetical protein
MLRFEGGGFHKVSKKSCSIHSFWSTFQVGIIIEILHVKMWARE